MSRQTMPPVVVPPVTGHHRQSLIVLHGRGSTGPKFGPPLLETHIPGVGLLQDVLPNARFIFPTAAKRRAKIYKRTPVHQWFDNWTLDTPTEREELQFEGLRESTAVIHGLLEHEIALVGADNVILWGLSQGCAASLVASLLWSRPNFAATIGMCGWLPLRKRMSDALDLRDAGEQGLPTTMTEEPEVSRSLKTAVDSLREQIGLPNDVDHDSSRSMTPVSLGHGTDDDRVPLQLAREANDLVGRLAASLEYREYVGLGHWYSSYMLRDIVLFIEREAHWPLGPTDSHGTISTRLE